ncbi:hypothetical protein [Leptolyngbya sp. FACHB-261]|uniref:hypothetical protein n=1 Tax=Leptolyngbya sp. FACHB-261 TaxID=2692806 RepID=UPI001684E88D|nr:hypothetical protein [Leptolyngbya sp. FACHB-261]MBD2099486.1 hypothetical protein [Leptolyngbya sp. FACHB-261]
MLIRGLGFAVGFFSLVASASAQVLTLPAQTSGLTPIQGRITNVTQSRVPVSDTATGSATRVTLEFQLQGCLDSLLPVISHPEIQGSRVTFYVTALNAHNEQSIAATCMVGTPKATAQVSVPGIFQRNQVRVVFMGQQPQQAR